MCWIVLVNGTVLPNPPRRDRLMTRCSCQSRVRSGFSLVELLVVIAILATLIGLLLPAVQSVRESARQVQCKNNLRNLSLAMLSYHESEQRFPYGFNWLEALWHAPILPHIEQQPLFDTLVFDEHQGNWATNGSANERACGTVIPVFRCPSMPVNPRDNQGIPLRVPVSYRGCAGSDVYSDDASTLPPSVPAGARALEQVALNGMLWGESGVQIADVRDGTSNTVIIGESLTDPDYVKDSQAMDYWQLGSPQGGGWVSGGRGGTEHSEGLGSTGPRMNSRLDPTQTGWVMEMAFGSWHRGGATFTFVDGSTRFIDEGIELPVYQALGSRKSAPGSEPPGSGSW